MLQMEYLELWQIDITEKLPICFAKSFFYSLC